MKHHVACVDFQSLSIAHSELTAMKQPEFLHVDDSLLELVPPKIAWDFCVLPKSAEFNSLVLYCLNSLATSLDEQAKIEFALGSRIECIAVDQSLLEQSINRHYPTTTAFLRNCDIYFRFQCPFTWSKLTPTDKETERHCHICKRTVYFCNTIKAARELGRQGKCIAFQDPNAGTFLGEVDLS